MHPRLNIQSRPGTQDAHVFSETFGQNIYNLPDKLTGRVLDVGAHIGCFTVACALRGAEAIHCYEPDLDNYSLLTQNIAAFPGVKAFRKAVWRNDHAEDLEFSGYDAGYNACGSCLPHATVGGHRDAVPVQAESLDDAILKITDNGKHRLRLLKIDAEGAEYPALYTSQCLGLVDELVGEAHTCDEFMLDLPIPARPDDLEEFLKSQGFRVRMRRVPRGRVAIFYAKRHSNIVVPEATICTRSYNPVVYR